ncbi:type IV pilin protein [Pseudomonadota bacterium]
MVHTTTSSGANSNKCASYSKGFSLIELMIVVAIIAILGGIGYPMYAEQVKKARRGDAQGALYGLSNAMEQYAARNPNTGYAGATIGSGANDIFPDEAPLDGSDKYYTLAIADINVANGYGNTFLLQATPKDKMAGDACGTFTLTNAGVRGDGGGADDVCWR